ncbi:vacuolar protein sorting-associated protein 2 homolog 3 isoform X2 [Eutrema salsugineum]|uniref:vacuolar protein sorting-associated protein 2 homolog 3 isoform X2 n=1 Tax=Eutrema salsugineum TaxID=72664 RepID=UPI000CECE977|nr:vacuolar protein sorting-associated protein 2 homolog 3 isoform X2 [Eutrema salsugineum]
MNIFAKKPNPREALRQSKREMTQATRGIEKEIGSLQSEEKKLVLEIKRTAKTGNEGATKILARQLIRLRQQIANLQGSRAQMRGIATHTQAMHAHTSVAAGIQGATKAMSAMSKNMDPAKQAKVMRDFQKQSAQMDMTTEMMSDAIDDALDNDEAEEETEDLTNQVLDEIGIDIASQVCLKHQYSSLFRLVISFSVIDSLSLFLIHVQLSSAPKGKIGGKNAEDSSSSEIDELEKRLAALR